MSDSEKLDGESGQAGSNRSWRTPGSQVVLFSHHSLLSYESQGRSSRRSSRRCSVEASLAWYWGHEHRCVILRRTRRGPQGRCIGQSGYPYFRKDLTNTRSRSPTRTARVRELAPPAKRPAVTSSTGLTSMSTRRPPNMGRTATRRWALGADLVEPVHAADGRILTSASSRDVLLGRLPMDSPFGEARRGALG